MMSGVLGISSLLKLVRADLAADKTQSILDSIVLISLMVLLMVLSGLKSGIINGFASAQLNTPESTRIFVKANGPITQKQLETLELSGLTSFVAPSIDYFNQRMKVTSSTSPNLEAIAEIIASGEYDPYLISTKPSLSGFKAAIGEDLAATLNVSEGDMVKLHFNIKNRTSTTLEFQVAAVINASNWMVRGIFIDKNIAAALSILSYAKDDRIKFDGSVANYGINDTDEFAEIRLYAKDLERVSALVSFINQMGWQGQSREELIEQRFALEQSARIIFLVILTCCLLATVITAILANLNRFSRLNKPLSGLVWHGLPSSQARTIFVMQSVLIAVFAWAFATFISLLVAQLLNFALKQSFSDLALSGPACDIQLTHILYIGIGALLIEISLSQISALQLSTPSNKPFGE